MTIKKTTLGLMATTLLMGATVCQAETLTVRAYNQETDKHAVKAIIQKHLNVFVEDAALIEGRTHAKKERIEKSRIQFATCFMNDIDEIVLSFKCLDNTRVSHLVIESDKGIKGFLAVRFEKYDACISEIFIEKEYLNHTTFQKLLNEVIAYSKKLNREDDLTISHMVLTYSKKYKAMFQKCGFELKENTEKDDHDGIGLTFNEYELIDEDEDTIA